MSKITAQLANLSLLLSVTVKEFIENRLSLGVVDVSLNHSGYGRVILVPCVARKIEGGDEDMKRRGMSQVRMTGG